MQGTIDKPLATTLRKATNSAWVDQLRSLRADNDRLRTKNERLRRENRELRLALDAHVARVRSSALFGPLELTAGTCVGPRRRRG